MGGMDVMDGMDADGEGILARYQEPTPLTRLQEPTPLTGFAGPGRGRRSSVLAEIGSVGRRKSGFFGWIDGVVDGHHRRLFTPGPAVTAARGFR